ncbi:hypothetical protein JCM10908_001125 [Rhodotorula pacifica]|uniref:uncharacterized protein n=1 Tax=Rhodotorula pacifica TaxID=1495444 RepID=UPI0031812339
MAPTTKHKGGPKGPAGMVDKVDGSKSFITRLPDELLVAIATFFNPPIPFELGHFVLPSKFTMEGRRELRALAAACKRFAKVLMPVLYRSLVFIDDKRRTTTVDFYKARSVHEHVREIYWQPSYLYNDMSPVFLHSATNLTYLVLAFLPQSVPDDFIADDYAGLTTLRRSFTDALRELKHLRALEIPFWESREDPDFHFGTEILPSLRQMSVGDWQEWDAFKPNHEIDVVKWLVHPDIDLEEGLLEGWAECLGKNARVLQLAAHSGWGRTDLPAKLPDVIRNASWYKDIKTHPLESLTFHGFNPVTSHKAEWKGTLPQFLSALQSRHLHTVTFLDVPSLRNKRRHILDWDNVDHLKHVTTLQISLATTVDEGEAAAEAEDHDEDYETDEVDEKGEMTLRISPKEIKALLNVFPSLQNLLLANFHRCKRPTKHAEEEKEEESESAKNDGEVSRFAQDTFQPAAREFINSLDLYKSFKDLHQVVFRSAEAELGVRFRREQGPGTHENEEGWHEELRRLY